MQNFTKAIKTKYKEAYCLYALNPFRVTQDNIRKFRNIISLFLTCFFITFSYSQNIEENENYFHSFSGDLKESSITNLDDHFTSFEDITIVESGQNNISSAKIYVVANAIVSWDKNKEYNSFEVVYLDKNIQKNNNYQSSRKVAKSKKAFNLVKTEKVSTQAKVVSQANFKNISSENSPFLITGNYGVLSAAILTTDHHPSSSKDIKTVGALDNGIVSKWLLGFYKHKLQISVYYKRKIKSYSVIYKLTSRPPPFFSFIV